MGPRVALRMTHTSVVLNLFEEDINVLTDNIKGVVQEATREELGKERKKTEPWITNEILDVCNTRRT